MRPTDGVFLRPAVAADLADMAEVYVGARRAGQMPPSPWSIGEVEAQLADRLVPDVSWVAELGGRVVGYVRFVCPDGAREAWVDDLYVHPARAGEGIGSALLGVVRGFLTDGFGLWVFAENHPARRFYAGQGLEEVEETDGTDNPEAVPEIRMVWPGR